MRAGLLLLSLTMFAAFSAANRQTTHLANASGGAHATAGPGDTVVDLRITRPLPNAFGRADIFGRTTDAGRVIVKFVGVEKGKAVFIRQDLLINSSETTMSRTPLLLPVTSTTNATGQVGRTPVTAQQTTTGLVYVPPQPSSSHSAVTAPITYAVEAGASTIVEGRRLDVHRIDGNTIRYSVQ